VTVRPQPLRIAVGIATAGRPAILAEALRLLAGQDRPPDRIVVCAPTSADVGAAADLTGVEICFGARGLPAQRNVILDRTDDCDVVLFLDDDFIPEAAYVGALERLHRAHPEVVMFTGEVLRDGVTTGGLSIAEAEAAIAAAPPDVDPTPTEIYNGYGCNMSVRRAVIDREGIRFDENLPLYGWLEDVDFSRALARYGSIARSRALRGVHLGNRSGRQPGKRLGYSQIANPVYIYRKGNLSLRRAVVQMGRNLAANFARLLRADPLVDRRGRALGNLLGLIDLLTGRLGPGRALRL
jgi:GT2 family glycosyltransferase